VFSCCKNVVMTPAEAEAWGLLQRLEWITLLDYNKVVVEMYCKIVVEDIRPKLNRSEYDFIIK
jgi:hypothetical protein